MLEEISGNNLIQSPVKAGPASKLGIDVMVNQAAQRQIQITFFEIPQPILTTNSVDNTQLSPRLWPFQLWVPFS